MADSIVKYTADGTTTDYSITFSYIARANVVVLVAGVVSTDFTFINDSTITTNVSNSDLELARNGSGEVILNNISIVGNTIKNNTNKGVVNLVSSGFGYTKFTGTSGVVIPFGGTATQPDPATNPIPVGDTRYNTDTQILETWDGNTYLTSMGPNPPITPTEFNDLLLEYTIIFG